MTFPITRLRRLRGTEAIRSLVRETRLTSEALVYPLFVCPGESVRKEVGSMPGVFTSAAKAGRFGSAGSAPLKRYSTRRITPIVAADAMGGLLIAVDCVLALIFLGGRTSMRCVWRNS